MSTNYYLHNEGCLESVRQDELGYGEDWEVLHIGKSSVGWNFALHVIPEMGLNTLEDWQYLWMTRGYVITDDYGEEISPEKMLRIITDREWHSGLRSHSGLGRGNGTYDLVSGEFS